MIIVTVDFKYASNSCGRWSDGPKEEGNAWSMLGNCAAVATVALLPPPRCGTEGLGGLAGNTFEDAFRTVGPHRKAARRPEQQSRTGLRRPGAYKRPSAGLLQSQVMYESRRGVGGHSLTPPGRPAAARAAAPSLWWRARLPGLHRRVCVCRPPSLLVAASAIC